MGTPTNFILQAGGVEVLESPQLVQASALLGAAGLEALWSVRGVAPELQPTLEWRLQGWIGMRLRGCSRDTQQFWWPKEKVLGPSREQGRSAEIPVPPEPGLRGLQGTAGP